MYLKTNPDPDRMCYSHFTVATGYISVLNIYPLWLYPLIIPVNFTLPVVNLYIIHTCYLFIPFKPYLSSCYCSSVELTIH